MAKEGNSNLQGESLGKGGGYEDDQLPCKGPPPGEEQQKGGRFRRTPPPPSRPRSPSRLPGGPAPPA